MTEKERKETIEGNIGLIYMVVYQMGINEQDFDDMVGVGSVALIRAIDSHKETSDGELSSYVCKSVRNAVLNAIRDESKHNFDEEIDVASNYSFENEVAAKDLIEQIIRGLDAQERKLVRLRFVECYTIKQISNIIGLTYHQVEYTLKKIRNKAKKIADHKK